MSLRVGDCEKCIDDFKSGKATEEDLVSSFKKVLDKELKPEKPKGHSKRPKKN
jgi:hypothetical protein